MLPEPRRATARRVWLALRRSSRTVPAALRKTPNARCADPD